MEPKLENEQAVFKVNRQTMDNIFIVRNITERAIEKVNEINVTFIDLRVLYDTV